jgi:HEAT repeat protein
MRLLKEGLADARPMVRARAAHGLGCLGPEAIPLLAARLGEDDPYDRLDAIAALSLIGRETDAVMPLLIRGLEDSDEIVRLNAAGCVAVLGPRAKALIPALVKLAGEFEEVRPILREIDAEAAAKVGIP